MYNIIKYKVKTRSKLFVSSFKWILIYSLTKNTVIKSAAVMNTQNWPDEDALNEYGDTDILNLFNIFQKPLEARSVEFVSSKSKGQT